MKKRDLFWLSKIMIALIILLLFSFIALNNIFRFNISYMQEEREELQIFKRQIEWAVTPLLKNKDFKTLQEYCKDFEGDDITIRIFDKNKNLVATSKSSDKTPLIPKDSRILKDRLSKWETYRRLMKDKRIGIIDELNIDDGYYLELTISEYHILETVKRGELHILLIFTLCIGVLLYHVVQTIYVLGKSFNNLNESVNKIANGELDTNIDVQQEPLLEELTLSIQKMTKRLKTQITRLAQLEQYKSMFLQNITHEIKTPITAINSAIELLETQTGLTSSNKECLDIIHFQTDAINKLVNDILILSEVEIEKTNEKKNFKSFCMNTMIEGVINNFSIYDTKINLHNIENIIVYANEDLLSTAVSNLISNAVKYSESELIDVFLVKNNENIEIQIKDYGIGIPEEHLNHIFERFYRVDKARSRQKGGTGLGLSITKNIVELHNGTVSVESEINRGTVFTLTIPV